MPRDSAHIDGKFVVRKFSNRAQYEKSEPYEQSAFPNVLLNEGITRVLNLLVGGGGTAYTSAAGFIGVGDSTASSGVATSTGLLAATNRLYVAISSISIAAQTVTWRSVFSSVQSNYNWREFSVCNSSAQSGENLNRAVSNQGTKVAGQVWTLDLSLTVS